MKIHGQREIFLKMGRIFSQNYPQTQEQKFPTIWKLSSDFLRDFKKKSLLKSKT